MRSRNWHIQPCASGWADLRKWYIRDFVATFFVLLRSKPVSIVYSDGVLEGEIDGKLTKDRFQPYPDKLLCFRR